MICVIDASVAVRWLLKEEEHPHQLRKKCQTIENKENLD